MSLQQLQFQSSSLGDLIPTPATGVFQESKKSSEKSGPSLLRPPADIIFDALKYTVILMVGSVGVYIISGHHFLFEASAKTRRQLILIKHMRSWKDSMEERLEGNDAYLEPGLKRRKIE